MKVRPSSGDFAAIIFPMAVIVSVSYDETLLRTRHLLLEGAGHKVTSALGFHEARELCTRDSDLVIIGHSIPRRDKLEMIACYRAANPNSIVIALTRAGEERLKEVDHYVNPGEPEDLLRAVERIVGPRRKGGDNLRFIR